MKMKRLSLPGAILGLGLLIGVSGPALANLFTTFTQSSCTGAGGFYSELNVANTGLAALASGPYGAICVTDVNGAVTVQAETFNDFFMVDGGALALNFAGTGGADAGGFTLSAITFSPGAGPCISGGGGNEDGFGNMNFKVNCQGAAADAMTQIQVTGTDTILVAADVLAFNALGFDAGMHIFVGPSLCTVTATNSCTGFAAENINGIPETPEPQSLALLGIGLIGLGLIRRRRVS